VDIALGIKALSTFFDSTFFEWKNGSISLFWYWANELQQCAKFGFTPFIMDNLPNHTQRASKLKSPLYEKILSNVVKALKRGYLEPTARKISKV